MFNGNGHNKQELHFWVMPNVGFATRKALEPHLRLFEETHPNVKIVLSIHPWSLAWNRIMDVVKGRYNGPLPDVLQVGTTWVATLAHLGTIEKVPATGVFPEESRQSSYVWDPGAQGEDGNDLFCVPWFIDLRVLFYRRDVFDALGLSPDILQDWKGFFLACTEIKRYLYRQRGHTSLVAPLGIPGQKPGVLMHDLAPWIWGGGGDFFSNDMTTATLEDPKTMIGCEFYYDLINQGFMPIPETDLEQRRLGAGFFTGHYAMQISGSWPIDYYLNPDWPYAQREVTENFDVALVPAGPDGRFTFLGGSNLAVTSASQKKDLAWEFTRFMSEPERQLTHARGIGSLPPRLASMEPLFTRYPIARRVFWDSIAHARRLPRLIELGSVEQIIYTMGVNLLGRIRSAQYNHQRLQQELHEANDSMNAVLSLHRYGTKSAMEPSL